MKRFSLLVMAGILALASCQKYDAEIAELQRKIDKLTTDNSNVNNNVSSWIKIVEALQTSAELTTFTPIKESGKVIGYTLTFKEEGKPAETVTVYNSEANVSVGADGGKYYWMVDGQWLTDDSGSRVEACQGPVVPQFRLVSGKIEASLDGGVSWKNVGEVGTPVIDQVNDSEDALTIVLAGGQSISLPKQKALTLTLSPTSQTMAAGGGRSVNYTISGGTEDTSVLVYAKDGWKASVTRTNASKGYIEITSPDAASQSEVLVFVSDNAGRAVVASISVTSTK
ncbi:MAG: hypothetical protein IIU16_05490 [Bacteroidales bacterium]|nr:hypothetical protein [Bacteroidales bacterium]